MARKRALITGINGQDGSYLAEFLLEQDYEVHGLYRAAPDRKAVASRVQCYEASIHDYDAVSRVVSVTRPEECYHLAAQTFIGTGFVDEFATTQTNATGTHHVLAALREFAPDCRLFFAGSSEMFGDVRESPQTEDTPFRPRTVYGVSKVTGYYLMRHYREAHRLHASCGILYNHESPRRGPQFVTRKITSSAARIKAGLQSELRLGNLDAVRDWGHARDFVQAMWLMVQQPVPDDYILATGVGHRVRDFAELAFAHVGLKWSDYVISDPQFQRPLENHALIGLPAKARRKLGWKPVYSFESLINDMIEQDLQDAGVRN